jgi:hypothetical protein
MIQRGDGLRLELKANAVARCSDLDGHYAAQAHIDRAIDIPHAPGADLRLDSMRSELRAAGDDRLRWIRQHIDGRLVEKTTARFDLQHAFDTGADFRIRATKQRSALTGRTILRRLVQLLDFSPMIRGQHAA